MSHQDGSFEYPQHMFWLKNKKFNFQLRPLIRGPAFSGQKANSWLRVKMQSHIVFFFVVLEFQKNHQNGFKILTETAIMLLVAGLYICGLPVRAPVGNITG